MSVLERIQRFNQTRDPQLVALKYEKMQADVFAFFRGTCHLFYEDWPAHTALNTAPLTWICGDLHLENFGAYKGDDRLTYFDINDFDESALAPCTWELARFLTSVRVAAQSLDLDEASASALCDRFLQTYTLALSTGQARTVERETATGMVEDLLAKVKDRDRTLFLDERSQLKKGKRTLIRDKKHPDVPALQQNQLIDFFEQWRQQQPNPEFFKVLDITQRISGLGSLGVRRYALLVEGKGSPNQNYLLDFKAQPESALNPALTWKQPQYCSDKPDIIALSPPSPPILGGEIQNLGSFPPRIGGLGGRVQGLNFLSEQYWNQPTWDNPAQRVVAIAQRMQGMPPALLTAIAFEQQFYTLKELQPTPDKLNLEDAKGKLGRLEKVIATMGNLTAWAQLRSSGRQGSAIADELIAFAQDPHWHQPLLDYTRAYSRQVMADYQAFCHALGAIK